MNIIINDYNKTNCLNLYFPLKQTITTTIFIKNINNNNNNNRVMKI